MYNLGFRLCMLGSLMISTAVSAIPIQITETNIGNIMVIDDSGTLDDHTGAFDLVTHIRITVTGNLFLLRVSPHVNLSGEFLVGFPIPGFEGVLGHYGSIPDTNIKAFETSLGSSMIFWTVSKWTGEETFFYETTVQDLAPSPYVPYILESGGVCHSGQGVGPLLPHPPGAVACPVETAIPTPEPATFVLLLTGLLAIVFLFKKQRRLKH